MVKPWLDAGYHAVTVDVQGAENPHPNRRHIIADVRKFRPMDFTRSYEVVFGFPPCTHLAVSGARWFKDKGLPKLIEALQIVNAVREICEASDAPWMIENPVGTLATYWREPDYTFDPCDYGDPYTKKTCLWVGNGFVMPPKVRIGDMFAEPTVVEATLGSMIHRMPPSENRGDLRSVTPMGFAEAVFRENGVPKHPRVPWYRHAICCICSDCIPPGGCW